MFRIVDEKGTVVFASRSENACDMFFKTSLQQRAMEGEDFFLYRRDKSVEGGWDFRGIYYYEDDEYVEMSRVTGRDFNIPDQIQENGSRDSTEISLEIVESNKDASVRKEEVKPDKAELYKKHSIDGQYIMDGIDIRIIDLYPSVVLNSFSLN